jgi:hypothetical protein
LTRRAVLRWQDGLDQIIGVFDKGEPVHDSVVIEGNLFRLFQCSDRYAHFEFQGPAPIPESWQQFVAQPLQEKL